MTNNQDRMWGTLADMRGGDVLRYLTDYHGMQLLDDGFYEHLVGEGVMEPEPVICGYCNAEIAADEWEENGGPSCIDCMEPFCPDCRTPCSDGYDRCPGCAAEFEKEVVENEESNGVT